MRLDTWKRISRHDWQELPMPDSIIDLINEYGEDQSSDDDNFIFKKNDKSFLTSLAVSEDHLLRDFTQDEGAMDPAELNNEHNDDDLLQDDINDDIDNEEEHENEELPNDNQNVDFDNAHIVNDLELPPILEDNDPEVRSDDNSPTTVRSDDSASEASTDTAPAIHNIDSSVTPDNIITPTEDEERPSTQRYSM